MNADIEKEVITCTRILSEGGLILYPTDTIWGIGCDATNEKAVQKIFALKERPAAKSMIILLADKKDISRYAEDDPMLLHYISNASRPVTAIYKEAKNVARSLINEDGAIAMRVVKDEFCAALIQALKKPLVSSSANVSGNPPAAIFAAVDNKIKKGVDYIVQHRQSDFKVASPSLIIRMNEKKEIEVIRS